MARKVGRLSAAAVEKATAPGMYPDGAGLYLLVGPNGAKSWIYRFMMNGRAREMGIGPLHTVGLKEARSRALDCRRMKLDGIDPLEARRAARTAAKLEQARSIKFKEAAAQYIAANSAGWKNAKHAQQWANTLQEYAFPVIGDLPVGDIDVALVTKVLRPIWTVKVETASRVRGRVESILDFCITNGWRVGPNPAAWRGCLENILPAPSKIARVEHHAALPWREAGAFMVQLRGREGIAARALEFAILTAARSGEVRGMRWQEIDWQHRIWIVPADRMKAGREHRVALSDAALDVLRGVRLGEPDGGDLVFASPMKASPAMLSDMTLTAVLRRMKRGDLTAHGFRSTFRDWAAETGQPADLAEAALAHVAGDKTVLAYQRGDLLDRRRRLMDAWASWCSRPAPVGDNVVQLATSGAVAHA